MPPETEARWNIVEAALTLAARQGWAATTLADIAREAGLSPEATTAEFPTKHAILDALNRHVDARMMKDGIDEGGSVKDHLFELLMRRLDALEPHRAGVRAMLRGTVGVDPLASLMGVCSLQRSMGLALEAAGTSASGPLGCMRANVLGAIYLRVLALWLRGDATNDRVMAELDKALARAERMARAIAGGFGRRRSDREHDAGAQAPGG